MLAIDCRMIEGAGDGFGGVSGAVGLWCGGNEALEGVLGVLGGEEGDRVGSVILDLDGAEMAGSLRLFRAILEGLNGKKCLVGVRVGQGDLKDSSGRGDGVGAKLFRGMGKVLGELSGLSDVTVGILPWKGYWVASVEDAARISMRANQPGLGLFCSVKNWLETPERGDEARLHLAIPRMVGVFVDAGWEGKAEVAALIGKMRVMGFLGLVVGE